jgi:glycosyltransferase involved in cell wall biosynthesis
MGRIVQNLAIMKILYITDQVYLHGGAERILIQKLNYWAAQAGFEVMLITIGQMNQPPFMALDTRVKHVDLDINYIEGVSYYHPKNFGKVRKHFSRLKSAITAFNPDAIFMVSLSFSRFLLPFAAGGRRTFFEYHTCYYGAQLLNRTMAGRFKRWISQSMIRFIESKYTKIVFLNREELEHHHSRNGVIVPNFFEVSDTVSDLPKKKQAISLGRLTFAKGYDMLIDAWQIAARELPDWTLEIYGNGEDREALAKQIENKKVTGINLNPAIDKVGDRLAESAFYIMSSRFEAFPMVLLEAMSYGLPVATFDCPSGPRAILTENQDSLFAPKNDVEALARRIRQLIDNGQMRDEMGRRARHNVRRFSKETVMQQWLALIKTT